MGQKVHPIGLRLGIIKDHLSCWYANKRDYPKLLQEDYQIRQYIAKNLANASVAQVRIERKADQVEIFIHTARPGVVVGKGGQGIEKIRTDLMALFNNQRQIRVNVIEVTNVDACAPLMAEFIVSQLERRVSFRRVVRQALQRAQKAEGVQGIKIQVSGRLNGAEIARTEWIREGRVPLATLRADIDYAYKTAKTVYGILGVKVWIFRGEIIPGEENLDLPSRKRSKKIRRQKFEDRSE